MQIPALLTLALLICACVANSGIDTRYNLFIRALQRQNSTPTTKVETSKAQKQVKSSTQNPNNQQRTSLNRLERQISTPITKLNINGAKKQVQSSSQDDKSALVADLVLSRQKEKAKSSTTKAIASAEKARDWHLKVIAHIGSSWQGFRQGKATAQRKNDNLARWKFGLAEIQRKNAECHISDAQQATGIARKMEISGVRLMN